MRERDIEEYLVRRVTALHGEVRKVRWIGRRGAPDRVVMLPQHDCDACRQPHPVWVELKATGEKPEPHQRREHERMRAMGQDVRVIDSLRGVDELLT